MAMVPENRMEQILAGENVTPECRTEYFAKEAIDNAGSGGGGSSLPKPGTAGNVLTSTGTAWESAPAPDATELVCTFAMGESITCDVSVSAILAAVAAKRPVVGVYDAESTHMRMSVYATETNKVYFRADNIEGMIFFNTTFIGVDDGEGNDTWTPQEGVVIGLPLPTDDGKIPMVDDGEYVLVTPKDVTDYLVEFTPDPQGATGSEMIATHGGSACTVADVVDAYEAGKTVKGKVSISDSGTTIVMLAPLTSITQTATGKCVVFGLVNGDMSTAAWATKTQAVIGYNDTSATSGNDIWAAVEG